jgi:Ca2+-transporting ATPase
VNEAPKSKGKKGKMKSEPPQRQIAGPGNDWHGLSAEEALAKLQTDGVRGLSQAEASRRMAGYGPNELQAAQQVSPWTLLLEQLKNIFVLILFIAVVLSAFLGHRVEAIAISVIVLFAVILGFIQEYRAERAIEALRKMAAPRAAVLRDGEELNIPARELVPGDIILLRAGDRVPADARLIEAVNLQVEEAALTGESVPAEKHIAPLGPGELAVGDRKNMVHAGTLVTYGRGRGVVAATGMQTEFGKIAQMLQTVEIGRTPLQKNLDKVGYTLARVAVGVVLLIVALGLLRGQPLLEMVIFGIALAVAVVPEALPAVVTISLAIGVQRMVRRNALIRRLSAVETLGSTSVICSDKTGTLTKDEMTVRKVLAGTEMFQVSGAGYDPQGSFFRDGSAVEPSHPLLFLLRAAALASDARLLGGNGNGPWHIKGDPTEGALVVAAAKARMQKKALDAQFPRIHEVPFTSETKRMTTLHQTPEGLAAYSKGAPEVILDSCSRRLTEAGEVPIGGAEKNTILATAREMAGEALRVLAVAYKPTASLGNAEQEMVFLGLAGMIDPPRPEAKEAVRKCEEAGIKPVMITGDHPVTAQAIALELGLLKVGRVVTGVELDRMSEEDLDREVDGIEVYARVSPAHKLRVVTALQKKGHFVAMTGDGVNDAPALKKADIGIGMGITGTDVTKEAASMTLTDDNFASIVAAVEEGRKIYDNIKKYLMYLLSANIGEILLMAGAMVAGVPLPLTAVQILYINLATDGLPALALAVDPPGSDLMLRKPRDPRTGIFTRPVLFLMMAGGIWLAVVNLGLFAWALNAGQSLKHAMTLSFVTLVLTEFFKAYNFRSDRNSILNRPLANRWLNLAVLWEIVLLALIIYLPFLQAPFGTIGLSPADWTLALGMAFTITPILELAKWMVRRGLLGKQE